MLLGCIADDFTGASDLANTLAREGMRTKLFVGVPAEGKLDCEAGVIALKSRSIPVAEAVAQSLAALERLREAGCRQYFFKYCSTFDSTAEGNIGPVAEALAAALDTRGVVVCPAFPATGRTVYQGHLFVGGVLLSQSGMERHPLTPMTDPDIRRWLAAQSRSTPGHIDHAVVRAGQAAIAAALTSARETLVVVDAICEADLRAIGTAAANATLLTGGSGIALGLPENFRVAGLLAAQASGFVANDRPALVLSGSCSNATRAQVACYQGDRPSFPIDIDRVIAGEPVQAEAEAFLAANRDAAPLVYSSAEPQEVRAAQQRHGASIAAEAVEQLFGALACHAVAQGFGRLVVAGGETSGAVVTALGLRTLELGAEIDPGVPALSAVAVGKPLALALKSGNFGTPDFLSRAVEVLGGGDG